MKQMNGSSMIYTGTLNGREKTNQQVTSNNIEVQK